MTAATDTDAETGLAIPAYTFTYGISPDASVELMAHDPSVPTEYQRPLVIQEREARQLIETLTKLFELIDARRRLTQGREAVTI
jgi:hypothetical protein